MASARQAPMAIGIHGKRGKGPLARELVEKNANRRIRGLDHWLFRRVDHSPHTKNHDSPIGQRGAEQCQTFGQSGRPAPNSFEGICKSFRKDLALSSSVGLLGQDEYSDQCERGRVNWWLTTR